MTPATTRAAALSTAMTRSSPSPKRAKVSTGWRSGVTAPRGRSNVELALGDADRKVGLEDGLPGGRRQRAVRLRCHLGAVAGLLELDDSDALDVGGCFLGRILRELVDHRHDHW